MPANYEREFALWLTQHGQMRAAPVSVLSFVHPKFGELHVSDYGEVFEARKETGEAFTAQPLGFVVDVATENLTTEQRALIRLDNANGLVMNQLRLLDLDDLQEPVTVVYRTYLDSRRTAPAIDPITLYVTDVKATRLAAEIEASADALPNVTAGIRYTIDRFPALAYL
jgi:hypothetical protein